MAPAIPVVDSTSVPSVTMEQMREVDRIMIEDLHIELIQMMENAGRNLARLAVARFAPARVLVLAGSGGNGGGGLVAARHLANHGVGVEVVLGKDPGELGDVPARQLDAVARMGVPIVAEPSPADLYIDALIGYSLTGNPWGRIAELIEWLGGQPEPILALDTPSGLDVTTGEPGTPSVTATATLTLAAPKTGLLETEVVGELYLGDISVPPSVYDVFGASMPVDLFAEQAVVRLSPG
ncbi:MAG: NAD(P)H-hydrate epimerase [Acidimicrobiia bacterium]|nr:NAD(P)H-hydrate epimerase [Acidimicrobiia bacterium]